MGRICVPDKRHFICRHNNLALSKMKEAVQIKLMSIRSLHHECRFTDYSLQNVDYLFKPEFAHIHSHFPSLLKSLQLSKMGGSCGAVLQGKELKNRVWTEASLCADFPRYLTFVIFKIKLCTSKFCCFQTKLRMCLMSFLEVELIQYISSTQLSLSFCSGIYVPSFTPDPTI